jgi:ElaB protein
MGIGGEFASRTLQWPLLGSEERKPCINEPWDARAFPLTFEQHRTGTLGTLRIASVLNALPKSTIAEESLIDRFQRFMEKSLLSSFGDHSIRSIGSEVCLPAHRRQDGRGALSAARYSHLWAQTPAHTSNHWSRQHMESTFNDNGQAIRGDTKAWEANPAGAVPKLRETGGQEVNNLMADVQDLLGRVAHVADPEIARLRTKVEGGLTAAKKALVDGTDRVQRHAKNAMSAGDSYVRDQPWQAVGIGAVAGLVVGFLVARR